MARRDRKHVWGAFALVFSIAVAGCSADSSTTATPDAAADTTTTPAPDTTDPDTTDPDTTDPDTTEPDTTDPDTTDPVTLAPSTSIVMISRAELDEIATLEVVDCQSSGDLSFTLTAADGDGGKIAIEVTDGVGTYTYANLEALGGSSSRPTAASAERDDDGSTLVRVENDLIEFSLVCD